MCSGDKANKVRIWDIRSLNRHIVQLSQHQAPVYHVDWCPYNKYLLASSGADKMLMMYDLRRCGLQDINGNTKQDINGNNNIPKECNNEIKKETSNDGIDSISKLLEDLNNNSVGNYYNNTCPELVFAHYGHTACIPEFDWCPSEDLTIISTDMDGVIQTWQPPNGMLNTFSWVLHSSKQNNTINVNNNNNIK